MNINMQGKCIFNIFIILIKIKKAPNNVSKTCEQTRDWSDELKASAALTLPHRSRTWKRAHTRKRAFHTWNEIDMWAAARQQLGSSSRRCSRAAPPPGGCFHLWKVAERLHEAPQAAAVLPRASIQRITCTPHSEDPEGGGWQPPPSPEDEIISQMLQFIVNR